MRLQRMFKASGKGFAALAFAGVALSPPLQAQAGLGSNPTQIALVARVSPRASIQRVGPVTVTARRGDMREASLWVRLSTNTGYRVVVVGTSSSSDRSSLTWVRGLDGEFHPVIPGSSLTVAKNGQAAGQREHEVSFRSEAGIDGSLEPMPVRCEIVVDPTI